MPPWLLETEAPDLWVQRWLALREARAKAEPKEVDLGLGGQGGLRRTRLE